MEVSREKWKFRVSWGDFGEVGGSLFGRNIEHREFSKKKKTLYSKEK
jgi:hypothetical protein